MRNKTVQRFLPIPECHYLFCSTSRVLLHFCQSCGGRHPCPHCPHWFCCMLSFCRVGDQIRRLRSAWPIDPDQEISNILKDWKSTKTIELKGLKPTLQFIGNKYFYERQSWTIWDSSLALWTAWLACGFIVHHHVSHLVGHLVNLQMLGHLHIVQPSPIKCSATEIFS